MDGGPWSLTPWALQGARTPPRCPAMSLSTPSVSSLPLPPPGHVRGSRLLAAGGHPLAAEGGHTPGWMLGRPGTAHSKGRCPPGPSAPAPRPWALSPARPPPWLPAGPPSCPAPAPGPGRLLLLPPRPGAPTLPQRLRSGTFAALRLARATPTPTPRAGAQPGQRGPPGRGVAAREGAAPGFPPAPLPAQLPAQALGKLSLREMVQGLES